MGSWNLESFGNIFADLAESTYLRRPNNIPIEELRPDQQNKLKDGKPVKFNFSRDVNYTQKRDGKEYKEVIEGGSNLPNDGVDKKKLIY